MRLGGPQSRSGKGGEEKNSKSQPGIEPQNPDHPVCSLVSVIKHKYCKHAT